MKHPNLTFALVVLLLLFFGFVNAQDITTKPDKAAHLTTTMKKRLQLDDVQLEQVTKINQGTATTLQSARSKTYESTQEKRGAIRGIWQNHSAQLKPVLNENQWTEFIAMKQEMRARMQQKRKAQFRKRRMAGKRGKPAGTESKPTTGGLTEEELEDLGGMDLFEDLDDEF